MAHSPGLNKEKLACGLAVLLLSTCVLLVVLARSQAWATPRLVYSYLFGSTPTVPLVEGEPLTTSPPPPLYHPGKTDSDPGPRDLSRRTPFAPVRIPPVIVIDKSKTKPTSTVGPVETVDPGRNGTLTESSSRPSILDGNSPVSYMGVLGLRGERYGMLRVKDGRFLNVREGDALADFDCTIVRIENDAIHLRTRNGIYHILRRPGSS